jgi:hypothetical protein
MRKDENHLINNIKRKTFATPEEEVAKSVIIT